MKIRSSEAGWKQERKREEKIVTPLILLSIVSFVNAIISILEVLPLVSPSLGSPILHSPSTELKGSQSLREHHLFSVRSTLEPFGRCM